MRILRSIVFLAFSLLFAGNYCVLIADAPLGPDKEINDADNPAENNPPLQCRLSRWLLKIR